MDVEDAALALVPPGINKVLQWRLAVSLSIGGLIVFAIWAVGGFGFAGFEGLARAGEIDKLGNRMAKIESNQQTGLRITLASEICRIHWLRMEASGEMWVELNKSFDARQEEYAGINGGHRYLVAECSKPK